jgi:hypothetical protein
MSALDGLGAGNCQRCQHCRSEWDRMWCGVYGIWIVSPSIDGADCPSFEEVFS